MIKHKAFQRKIEDFTCGHCGYFVTGDGYTNHCPRCLRSRHVDVNPGDRRATCGGMMKPVGLRRRGGTLSVLHRCGRCGFEKWNKTGPRDSFDQITAISAGLGMANRR